MRPKISFCTGCMNRTMHLKSTYIPNIEQCLQEGAGTDVEFVLVNYNSSDDLDEYVKSELLYYIDAGILNYFHTVEPQYWDMSHSKNVSHRLGQGSILCNLDADNFLGEDFYNRTLEMMGDNKKVFLRKRGNGKGGRLAVHREHFYQIGGYDENFFLGWGHEDMDLNKRLERIGLSRVGRTIDFEVIKHTKKLRTKYCRETDMHYSRDVHAEILEENNRNELIVANQDKVFGQAIVFKNFNYEDPIVLGPDYED